jgi:hypothetical protein
MPINIYTGDPKKLRYLINGWGWLVPALIVAGFLLSRTRWVWGLGLLAAGLLLWFLGKYLNNRPIPVFSDSGLSFDNIPDNQFLFLRMEWWGLILALVGAVLLIMSFITAPPTSSSGASSLTDAAPPIGSVEPRGGGDGLACFFLQNALTYSDSLTCLTNAGWLTLDRRNSDLNGTLIALSACPDGSLLILTDAKLSRFDGSTLTVVYPAHDLPYVYDTLACSTDGKIWMGRQGGVDVFEGSARKTYSVDSFQYGVREIVASPDGRVWAIGNGATQVMMFDGSAWTAVQDAVNDLALDRQGRVWTLGMYDGNHSGLAMYDDDQFRLVDKGPPGATLAIDGQGRAWVSTIEQGAYAVKDGQRTIYTRMDGDLPSNTVRSLAVDAHDRVWFGTEWGLAILDGNAWTIYHVSNSGLPYDDIGRVVVTGAGPNLPAPEEKAVGAITGRILQADGTPLVNRAVEVCVEHLKQKFSGETPCTGQPFLAHAQTDADGRFLLENVPAGYYYLTIEQNDGWFKFTDQIGVTQTVQVVPGKTRNLGDLIPTPSMGVNWKDVFHAPNF